MGAVRILSGMNIATSCNVLKPRRRIDAQNQSLKLFLQFVHFLLDSSILFGYLTGDGTSHGHRPEPRPAYQSLAGRQSPMAPFPTVYRTLQVVGLAKSRRAIQRHGLPQPPFETGKSGRYCFAPPPGETHFSFASGLSLRSSPSRNDQRPSPGVGSPPDHRCEPGYAGL